MDGHKVSALERLAVVETGRRRRWSEDEKARIVLESMASPRLVALTARRYNISRSLLLSWRRAFQTSPTPPPFVPAVITEPVAAVRSSEVRPGEVGRIEIVLSYDRRVIVGADVDAAALSRVLDVLDRR